MQDSSRFFKEVPQAALKAAGGSFLEDALALIWFLDFEGNLTLKRSVTPMGVLSWIHRQRGQYHAISKLSLTCHTLLDVIGKGLHLGRRT